MAQAWGNDPVRAALATCPLWAQLSGPLQDVTVAEARLRTLLSGQSLFMAGDDGEAMYVVAAGQVVARLVSPEGDAVDLTVVGPGRLFGHLDLLDGGPRSCDAVAVGGPRW